MPRISEQVEWLNLIDRSGPFLAPVLLEEVFPQGLEKVEAPRRQRLRSAYEEWRDAVDDDDPQLGEIHSAWVLMVLQDMLEYEDAILATREALDDTCVYRAPEHGAETMPDYAVRGDDGKSRMLVSVWPPETDLEKPVSSGPWPASPLERMTLLCRANEVRLGLVTDGERWMVVNAPIGATSGYAAWLARLWWQEPLTLKAFQSLLGVRRCFGPKEETLDALLERSAEFQEEVTDTLGEQVRRAVEILIQSLGRADQDRNGELLKEVRPAELYEAGLTVMMRLVFTLCAEERGLLLLGDLTYDQNYAISTLRSRLREDADRLGVEVLERRHDAWSRMLAVFRAVYGGVEHESLRMPALGGSLFDPDRFPFLEGRAKGTTWRETSSVPLPIDNRTALLLLDALQVLEQRGGAQLLSYRALDVEQIGHVYEGLLEYTVARLDEVTVGLIGSQKIRHPSITLSELDRLKSQGSDEAGEQLVELTGRSEAAIRNALARGGDESALLSLVHACGGDEKLAHHLLPFADFIRMDSWGTMLVYQPGSFAVVHGSDRRETGTHYTPRSLTETIVEKALEPVVYAGPAEGEPRERWKLRTPAELLNLKVCDPAMGSGAFLVQVCRYLAEKLVQAWLKTEAKGMTITADGVVVDATGKDDPLPRSLDERLIIARRLIAERCLYGVDINPLAVELAKLSIWLVTMAKGRPFGFLDHNLRCGDSLLGLHRLDQLTKLAVDPDEPQGQQRLFGHSIGESVADAVAIRTQLRLVPIRDIRDVDAMAHLDSDARTRLEASELIADAMFGAIVANCGHPRAIAPALALLAVHAGQFFKGDVAAGQLLAKDAERTLSLGLPAARPRRRPFHWPLAFPEVFGREGAGFDAVVGNPPFLGNSSWKTCLGGNFQGLARILLGSTPRKIDLSVLFHRRASVLLQPGGCYGLLAANNISEGTAVSVGVAALMKSGTVYWSQRDMRWPGKASVVTAAICYRSGPYAGRKTANGQECDAIDPQLRPDTGVSWTPQRLEDCLFAFKGVDNSRGLSFVLTESDPWFAALQKEQDTLLRPYITGDDITTSALQKIDRYALDVGDLDLSTIARTHPLAHKFLCDVVKPTRTKTALQSYKGLTERWWQFWNHRAAMMRRLRQHTRCIVFSRVTKHPICMTADPTAIYIEGVVLIGFDRPDTLALCLSSPFTEWIVARQGAIFGVGASLRLSIREGIETFPLPATPVDHEGVRLANEFDRRAVQWCGDHACGLTKLMNQMGDSAIDDPAVTQLRQILTEIDRAVIKAYGWKDLVVCRGFHNASYLSGSNTGAFTLPPDQRRLMLDRLLEQNREHCGCASEPRLAMQRQCDGSAED